MEDIVFQKDDLYDQYEALLMQKDQINRELGSIRTAYLREFGMLLADIYQVKVDCIEKKKKIKYYQMAINQGESVDVGAIDDRINREMTAYYEEVKQMVVDSQRAQDANAIPAFIVEQSKKIYRRLAKKIHPDMYPGMEKNKRLMDLWKRITIAYHASDVDELENLEVLVNRELGDDDGAIRIPFEELEDRIRRVEDEIADIVSSEPYIFKELIDNKEKGDVHREKLTKEMEEHKAYSAELDDVIEGMLSESGVKVIWKQV